MVLPWDGGSLAFSVHDTRCSIYKIKIEKVCKILKILVKIKFLYHKCLDMNQARIYISE